MMQHELFVGVTTWNSEQFLEACLRAVRKTTEGIDVQLGVADNVSTDRSVAIAHDMGAQVHVERCSQSIALNRLLAMSRAKHTLLIHSDVVLLSPAWYRTCAARLTGDVALVSPEDIGCGPMTRPYGAGMPESCFMLFDTAKARECRTWTWVRRARLPWPWLRLDLENYYVTHDLPRTLARRGYTWQPMRVLASPAEREPVYQPPFTPEYWSDTLAHLRYGMGNFYSLDGVVTHYHNWFDRVPKDLPIDSRETTDGNGRGLPSAYLSMTTRRFLADLEAGTLVLPAADAPQPAPCATPRHEPDLTKAFAS
jgi:glycosyltransferase involved in cell wall biosynthesis